MAVGVSSYFKLLLLFAFWSQPTAHATAHVTILHGIPGRRKSIAFFITLGACLVALAMR